MYRYSKFQIKPHLAIRNIEKVWAAVINLLSAPKYNEVAKFTFL